MVKKEQTEQDNGAGSYEDFLQEMRDKGALVDGMEFAKDGIPLIQPPETRHSNASIIASVPNTKEIYGKKDETNRGALLDLMARTTFRSRNELIYFLDWVEWCEDFGTGLEGPMRYCVAINSEGGKSREQYIEAITSYRFRNYGNNDRGKPRPNGTKESGLS